VTARNPNPQHVHRSPLSPHPEYVHTVDSVAWRRAMNWRISICGCTGSSTLSYLVFEPSQAA